MRSGNKYLVLLVLALCAPVVANATNLRTLMTEAIVNGKSSGELDPKLVDLFATQTKSKEPVKINVERINQYNKDCAELAVMTSQKLADDKDGKPQILNLMFKLPLCTNGKYPAMLEAEEKRHNEEVMNQCKQSVRKGKIKGGFEEGSIEFKNCPKNGVVGIFYDGTCKDLGPGPNAPVKEFNLDKNGELSIQMMIPQSCIKAFKAEKNTWKLFIFERKFPEYPRTFTGSRVISWE